MAPLSPIEYPSTQDIDDISQITDIGLRNRSITWAYHELTLAMAKRLGASDVTWVGYATWASRTAGVFIRKELTTVLKGKVSQALGSRNISSLVKARLPKGLLSGSDRTFGHMVEANAQAVARGNLIVFMDIAPHFSRFLDMHANRDNTDLVEAFLKGFAPGQPQDGGQDLLKEAFVAYLTASSDCDDKKKAELIFMANLLIGYHEQQNLQGPINDAMDAPINTLASALTTHSKSRKIGPKAAGLIKHLGVKLRQVTPQWRALSTRHLMSLELPSGLLDLGEDVPLTEAGTMFPPCLIELRDQPLQDLLEQLDRTPNTTAGSAASDWARLEDRMNYVADLFRSRQRDPSLYLPPVDRLGSPVSMHA